MIRDGHALGSTDETKKSFPAKLTADRVILSRALRYSRARAFIHSSDSTSNHRPT